MAVVPLTTDEAHQLELHVNALTALKNAENARESLPAVTACGVANECLALYEELAANLPGGRTGLNVCHHLGQGVTLTTPEAVQLRGALDSLAAIGGDEMASDIANEILELYEERQLTLPTANIGLRDVTQTQLP